MEPFEKTALSLIVWPWNCDIWNFHLNNGDYLYLMDLGRIQMTWRMGLLRAFTKYHWRPVVGGAKTRFIKSLLPFQRFTLTTQIKGWDDKWLYIEHEMIRHGRVYCRTYIQAAIRGRKGTVPFSTVVKAMGYEHLTPPPLPPEWNFRLAR